MVTLKKRARHIVSDTKMRFALRRREAAWKELGRFDDIPICNMDSVQKIECQYWIDERKAMSDQILMGLRERGGYWESRGRKLVIALDGVTIADVTPEMRAAYEVCVDRARYTLAY